MSESLLEYTIVSGDTLSKLSARHDLQSWRDIYYHPRNADFRIKRPNPSRIYPGDVVMIPVAPGDGAFIGPPFPEQGDRGAHPPGQKPEPPKRQEKTSRVVEKTTILADSFWVDQQRWKPTRKNNIAQWFVDGSSTFSAMLKDLRRASSFIYLTDWAITPLFHLWRTGKLENSTRLRDVLLAAAQRGVQVRIMLWDSADKTPGGLDNHDIEAERSFERAHKNIRVSRNSFATYWSHHQKTLVVDGKVAFLGGLDIATGRWDTPRHPLYANVNYFTEFYNPNLGLDDDEFDRNEHPRMPWHDVHMRIEGPAALDVEANFVERWNQQRKSGRNETAIKMSRDTPEPSNGKQSVQIIRSVGQGSAGVPREQSIHDAYINSIRNAQHFIYIENQFFTSNFGTSTVANDVANEIAQRVIKAIDKKETIRVVIVIPVHPEGDVDKWATQELMHWQYQTIVRSGGNSLIGQLRAKLGKDDVSDYLAFFNLRAYGRVGKNTVTEQVYVHTKMMITDDRVAIIGSANINDRSLLGDRDSELSAIVIDNETAESEMNGAKVLVRKFAHDLRLNLWQEHLGIPGSTSIKDPVVDSVYKDLWLKTAQDNTRIFERVFPNIASDRFKRLKDQRKAAAFDASKAAELGKVKGTLTLYPLEWLVDEDLETSGYPDPIFTWYQGDRPPTGAPA